MPVRPTSNTQRIADLPIVTQSDVDDAVRRLDALEPGTDEHRQAFLDAKQLQNKYDLPKLRRQAAGLPTDNFDPVADLNKFLAKTVTESTIWKWGKAFSLGAKELGMDAYDMFRIVDASQWYYPGAKTFGFEKMYREIKPFADKDLQLMNELGKARMDTHRLRAEIAAKKLLQLDTRNDQALLDRATARVKKIQSLQRQVMGLNKMVSMDFLRKYGSVEAALDTLRNRPDQILRDIADIEMLEMTDLAKILRRAIPENFPEVIGEARGHIAMRLQDSDEPSDLFLLYSDADIDDVGLTIRAEGEVYEWDWDELAGIDPRLTRANLEEIIDALGVDQTNELLTGILNQDPEVVDRIFREYFGDQAPPSTHVSPQDIAQARSQMEELWDDVTGDIDIPEFPEHIQLALILDLLGVDNWDEARQIHPALTPEYVRWLGGHHEDFSTFASTMRAPHDEMDIALDDWGIEYHFDGTADSFGTPDMIYPNGMTPTAQAFMQALQMTGVTSWGALRNIDSRITPQLVVDLSTSERNRLTGLLVTYQASPTSQIENELREFLEEASAPPPSSSGQGSLSTAGTPAPTTVTGQRAIATDAIAEAIASRGELTVQGILRQGGYSEAAINDIIGFIDEHQINEIAIPANLRNMPEGEDIPIDPIVQYLQNELSHLDDTQTPSTAPTEAQVANEFENQMVDERTGATPRDRDADQGEEGATMTDEELEDFDEFLQELQGVIDDGEDN